MMMLNEPLPLVYLASPEPWCFEIGTSPGTVVWLCQRSRGGSMMGALPVGLGGLMQVGISVFDRVRRLVCLARSVPRGAVRE